MSSDCRCALQAETRFRLPARELGFAGQARQGEVMKTFASRLIEPLWAGFSFAATGRGL